MGKGYHSVNSMVGRKKWQGKGHGYADMAKREGQNFSLAYKGIKDNEGNELVPSSGYGKLTKKQVTKMAKQLIPVSTKLNIKYQGENIFLYVNGKIRFDRFNLLNPILCEFCGSDDLANFPDKFVCGDCNHTDYYK